MKLIMLIRYSLIYCICRYILTTLRPHTLPPAWLHTQIPSQPENHMLRKEEGLDLTTLQDQNMLMA